MKSVMECWCLGDRRDQVGDVFRPRTNQGLVHEETQFVFDSLHNREPMQLPKSGSYMVAWFQVENESRRRAGLSAVVSV